MENAIAKINTEMQKAPNNKNLEIIGQYIIDRCSDIKVAESVNSGKNLCGAMKAIEGAARKKGSGCVMMRDEEIFDSVDEYLGITKDAEARRASKAFADGEPTPAPANFLDLEFEDLI